MRKSVMVFVAAMAALVSACGGAREVELPLSEVQSRLTNLPREADVFRMLNNFPGTRYRLARVGNQLTWHFTMNGREYGRYIVELAPTDSGGTSVAARFEEVDATAAGTTGQPADYAYLRETARIAGDESVLAAIEGRAADMTIIQARLGAHVVSDPMSIARSAGAMMNDMRDDANSAEGWGPPAEDQASSDGGWGSSGQ